MIMYRMMRNDIKEDELGGAAEVYSKWKILANTETSYSAM
jgi:hypothetical protein